MSRVDAHHHVWDLSVRDQAWLAGEPFAPIRRSFGVADLAPEAAAAGVTATVLVQTVPDPAETPELLQLAVAHDLVAAVTGWVDLTSPSVRDELAALLAGPGGDYLRAIRHLVQDEADAQWLCRSDVRRGLRAVADAGLVYELLVKPHQLPAAIGTVGDLPDAAFVLDHLAKPPIAEGATEPWRTDFQALAGHPNVACKLSGLVTEADWTQWTVEDLRPYVDVALESFGPERLLFGSDWPVCLLASSYAGWVEATDELVGGLSAAERSAVTGANARRLYHIEE
jgi:L-fuconolactonase